MTNTMTAEKLFMYASQRTGFALYPEMDSSVRRRCDRLVAAGQCEYRTVELPGWTLTRMHAL